MSDMRATVARILAKYEEPPMRFQIAIVPKATPNADSRWVDVVGDCPFGPRAPGSEVTLWDYLNSLAPDDHFAVMYRRSQEQDEHEAGDKAW
jgi:hypothetical protein